jgi:hypothetical protein
MTSKHQFQIPRVARPGEIWFFVNLSMLTSHTPDLVAQLVEEKGYTPELRYVERFIEGERRLDVALLIYQEQLDPDTMPVDLEDTPEGAKLMDDWEALATTLQPDLAVTLRRGCAAVATA